MKPYQQGTGITGRDLEKQDDGFKTESIQEIFPADKDGNRESLGNSSMHDLKKISQKNK